MILTCFDIVCSFIIFLSRFYSIFIVTTKILQKIKNTIIGQNIKTGKSNLDSF